MPRGPGCALSIALLLLSGCNLPADPEKTSDRIQDGTLRVGEVAGNEEALEADRRIVAVLAEGFDARIEWQQGEAHDLVYRLEHGEIDLIVGGLPANSPLSDRFGVSREAGPLFGADPEARRILAVRSGENAFLLRVNDAISSSGEDG